tara:strand:- start:638 stop:964 length:327 start_codon:yes stop_codon:yes gene_type:complete
VNKILIILPILILGFSNIAISDVKGVVVLDHYECKSSDHIVIETNLGYTLAEVYAGYSKTHEGHIVYGDLHSYSFKKIYDEDGKKIGRLWLDDYMASESSALEWCYEE